MTRKTIVRQFGPLRGADLERHIDQKVQVGSIVNFGIQGINVDVIYFYEYDKTFQYTTDIFAARGRVILLDTRNIGDDEHTLMWRVHHLDSQRQYYVVDYYLRRFLKLKVQDNWFKRFNKGKISHLKRKHDRR